MNQYSLAYKQRVQQLSIGGQRASGWTCRELEFSAKDDAEAERLAAEYIGGTNEERRFISLNPGIAQPNAIKIVRQYEETSKAA